MEISDSCLRLNGFIDPWIEEKNSENAMSLQQLSDRLNELDRFPAQEKWMEIFKGIFAGNIFDWGALVVSQILENDQSFGLKDAMKQIQRRPWLIDGFDAWLKRLEVIDPFLVSTLIQTILSNSIGFHFVLCSTRDNQGPIHKCAVIFVDNSGVDFILGVIPFARELLLRGTKVIFCANKEPSLNDITIHELDNVLRKCCDKCSIIKKAYDTKQLLIYGNGQSSACLDLRRISPGNTTA